MKGEWIHDTQRDIWHLVWQIRGEDAKDEDAKVDTWCHLTLPWDAPMKSGADINWADVVHDECLRKSEEVIA